jgi:hypothetical protein
VEALATAHADIALSPGPRARRQWQGGQSGRDDAFGRA